MTRLTFVIPIRHPENVRDPAQQQRLLSETLASVSAQDDPRFSIVLVCNPGQKLPPLPPQAEVLSVDLPPNRAIADAKSRQDVYDSIRLDKGRRIRAAVARLLPADPVMVVDDDDLISRRIAGFVLRPENVGRAWYVENGFLWRDGARWLAPCTGFHRRCGTSLILPAGTYAHFADPDRPEADIARELGSHTLLYDTHPAEMFSPLPFAGAIYRVFHGNASQVNIRSVSGSGSDSLPSERQRGRYSLARLLARRYRGRGMRREFFGQR